MRPAPSFEKCTIHDEETPESMFAIRFGRLIATLQPPRPRSSGPGGCPVSNEGAIRPTLF